MNSKDFFDNLNCFFNEDADDTVDIDCTLYKNEQGKVMEVRVWNPEYDEFMVITRSGEVQFINVDDYQESLPKNPKK